MYNVKQKRKYCQIMLRHFTCTFKFNHDMYSKFIANQFLVPISSQHFLFTSQFGGGGGGLVVKTSDSGSRGQGFEPHSGRRVVSLSKTYLPPKSTGNTLEAAAPSQHD